MSQKNFFAVRLVVCVCEMVAARSILRIARAAVKAPQIAACRVLGERRHRSWCSPQNEKKCQGRGIVGGSRLRPTTATWESAPSLGMRFEQRQ